MGKAKVDFYKTEKKSKGILSVAKKAQAKLDNAKIDSELRAQIVEGVLKELTGLNTELERWKKAYAHDAKIDIPKELKAFEKKYLVLPSKKVNEVLDAWKQYKAMRAANLTMLDAVEHLRRAIA